MERGLPATHPLVQGSISPWVPPAEQGPGLGFPDYPGQRHMPCGPQPLFPPKPRVLGLAGPGTVWPPAGDQFRTEGFTEDSTAEPSPLPRAQARGHARSQECPVPMLTFLLFSRGGTWGPRARESTALGGSRLAG